MKLYVGDKAYNLPGGKVKNAIMGLLVLVIIVTGFYSIGADEAGIVLRFGKYVRSTDPGLHLKIPFGIETVRKVKVKKVFKEEFGFRTLKAGIKTQYSSKSYLEESIMLTGDLNVAEVEWSVQFRVKNPYNFLFKIKDPEETLRAMSESVVRKIVGDRAVTDILTLGRIDIAKEAETGLQELLDSFESGIQIVTVQLQNVNPPDPVRPAFNEVNRAKQDKATMINEAWEDYNKRIPRARGEAEQMIAEAEGYALKRVNQALGDVSLFNQIYKEYRLAPDVTRRRLYLETMGEILSRMEEIYIVDEDQKSILPLLEIGKDRKGGDGK